MENINQSLFNYFNSFTHQSTTLDFFIILVAKWYGLVILFALAIYLFKHRDNPKKGVRDLFVVGVTAVFAYAVAYAIKDFFQIPRPLDPLYSINPQVESMYSFPSGHATFFMALASSLWFYHRRLAVFFGISAVIIGVARVSAGIHFPIDILGGLFLGFVIGTTIYKLIAGMTEKIFQSRFTEDGPK